MAPENKKQRPFKTVYTRAETKEQEEAVAAILPHQTVAAVKRAMRERFGITPNRTQKLVGRVRERWVREDEASGALQVNRAEAVRRVKRQIGVASGRKDQGGAWVEKPDHSAVARYEHILANLQGTYAPVKVDVVFRVSESIMPVIGNLTPEQVQEILERQRALRELEERDRARTVEAPLPALPARRAR